MRSPATAVLLLSVCVFAACGQANRETSPPPIQLEEEWGAALIRRDPQAFERLLAPGFVYTENALRQEMGLPNRDTYRTDGD